MLAVQGVERPGGLLLVALIAHQLPHDGPVLLLNMGLVVLLVGTRTGEDQLLLLAIAEQVAIDEAGVVVGVKAQKREGQQFLQFVEGLVVSL